MGIKNKWTSNINQKISQKRKVKGPLDDLNNWQYCDPDARIDILPQPFRFINQVLEESIMRNVNTKIEEIDQLKTNPSYEGNVTKIQPTGAYEIDGITCFSQEENSLGYVMAGDNSGNLYLLDISNKARLTKFDTKEKKPIIDIKMHSVKYGDRVALVIFVVYLAKYQVDCFLMFAHDLINVRKVSSFGKEFKPPVEQVDKKAPPATIKKSVDPKKQEEVDNTPKIEYLDNYPLVINE